MELFGGEDGSKMLVYAPVRTAKEVEPRTDAASWAHCPIKRSLVFGLSNPLEYVIMETNICPAFLKPHSIKFLILETAET